MPLTYLGGLEDQNTGEMTMLAKSINKDFESCLKYVEQTLVNTGTLNPKNFDVNDMNIVADYEIVIFGFQTHTIIKIINFDNHDEPIYIGYQETTMPDEPYFVDKSISNSSNECLQQTVNQLADENRLSQTMSNKLDKIFLNHYGIDMLKINPEVIAACRNYKRHV